MNVYVAAKYDPVEMERARKMMATLRTLGHQITYDWTQNGSDPPPGMTPSDYLEHCAELDMRGVGEADLLVLLCHEKGKGQYTELGLALAWGTPVVAVGSREVQNVFLHDRSIRHAKDDAQVIEWLGAHEKAPAFDDDEEDE